MSERGRVWVDWHKAGRWFVQLDTTNRNRLSVFCYYEGGEDSHGRYKAEIGVQFGNGSTDPVWTIGAHVALWKWFDRWIERHAPWLEAHGVGLG